MARFDEDDTDFAPTLAAEEATETSSINPEEDAVSATIQEETPVEEIENPTQPEGESTESTPAASKEDAPVDISKFISTVESAVTSANEDGSPTDEGIVAVREAYHGLEGTKPKAAARKWTQDEVFQSVRDGKGLRAFTIMNLDEKMKEGGAKKSGGTTSTEPRKPVDPTEAWVESLATVQLATFYIDANKPDGLAEDAADQVSAKYNELHASVGEYLTWLNSDKESRGDEPEVDQIVKNAARLAVGKKTRSANGPATPFTGERKDVGVHIAQAFENEPSGKFLKVADIVNFKSSEYGDRKVSAGAVSQRIDNDKLPEGLKAATVEGVKGVQKA